MSLKLAIIIFIIYGLFWLAKADALTLDEHEKTPRNNKSDSTTEVLWGESTTPQVKLVPFNSNGTPNLSAPVYVIKSDAYRSDKQK